MKFLLYCQASGPKDQFGIAPAFEKLVEADAIPMVGDEISFEVNELGGDMEVCSTNWQMNGSKLVPTVHLVPTSTCSEDAFLAAGWTRA